MRPIQRPALAASVFQAPATALLMQTLGEYCSLCERPLNAEAWAWNKHTNATTEARIPPTEWDAALLVCHACADAAARRTGPPPPLVLPDEHDTFALGPGALFIYALETIDLVYLDEDGRPEGLPPERVVRAIVRGTTPAAAATIAWFDLDTPHFDPATSTLRIPRADMLARIDPRVDQRTAVWHAATAEARRLLAIQDPAERTTTLQLVRTIAVAAGHWSIWATVFWQQFGDRAVLETLLFADPVPPAHAAAVAAAAGPAGLPLGLGPGSHNAFPGTRRSWLP